MVRSIMILFCVLLALVGALGAHAQQAPANANPPPGATSTTAAQSPANPPPAAQDRADPRTTTGYVTYKTPYEFWLTGLTIAMLAALGVLLAVVAYLRRLTHEFYKAFLILTVVFAALFLIVAGYSDQQTAPVYSLLGTIAGYIFGRTTSPGGDPENPERPQNA